MKGLHDRASNGTFFISDWNRASSATFRQAWRLAHSGDGKWLITVLVEPGRYTAVLADSSGMNGASLSSEVLFSHACRSQALVGLEQEGGFWASASSSTGTISIEGQSPPPLRGGSWGRRVPVAALEDSLESCYTSNMSQNE